MTKLTDLSEQALAELLGLPLDKARKWLVVASSISDKAGQSWFNDPLWDFESAPSLRHSAVKELMALSVEEVQQMKRTGELYRRFPYFKRRAPKDAETRLRYLRELLGNEPEFGARYPAAYELLFEASSSGRGLFLPSFGVRILENTPAESILAAGWFQEWKMSQESGDAFSTTFERRLIRVNEVDQEFASLDLGYIRGVLLAILSREEYAERIATDIHNDAVREELGAPAQSSVRITDLRLATTLKPEEPKKQHSVASGALKKALPSLLSSLERPITPNRILQWKWDRLWEDSETRGQKSEEAETKIVRVSFAAAALLLFLDLGMPDTENPSNLRLANQIGQLADIIRKLTKSLNANAKNLEALLAYRAQNRPSAHGQEFYEALFKYRMGKEPSSVAKDLGLTPYKSSPSEPGGSDMGGTKDWKNRLAKKLNRGAAFEKQKYPRAAAVFANRHKHRIARKARVAYRVYWEETQLRPEEEYSPWPKAGNSIYVSASTDWGLEVVRAYVQLGSCLKQQLEPFPTDSDFTS